MCNMVDEGDDGELVIFMGDVWLQNENGTWEEIDLWYNAVDHVIEDGDENVLDIAPEEVDAFIEAQNAAYKAVHPEK